MIQLRCPKCHAVLKVNDFAAGGMGSCPTCGQGLQLPVRHIAPDPSVKELSAERSPRRALLIAGLAFVLLLVLGWSWFPFAPHTPSAVLVSTIMNANAKDYSAAEESCLPDPPFLHHRPWFHWVCDGITKKGTVKKVAVLGEEIHGDVAKVRFSIEYNDGSAPQAEVALSKMNDEWKVSLKDLALMGRPIRYVEAPSLRDKHIFATKVIELLNPD